MGSWQGLGPNRGRFVNGADGFAVACRGCGILQWDERAAEAAEFRLRALPMETGRRGQLPAAGVYEAGVQREEKAE